MKLGLEGKTALVAASSKGLGKACALELAAEGANVVMCARSADLLAAAADEIREVAAAEVLAIEADLAGADGVDQVVSAANDRFGGVDVLVTNVGGPPVGRFDEVTDEQWLEAFETLHLSVVRLLRGVLPNMRRRKWGRVIAIQSSSVKQPVDGLTLSNGVRPAVAGLFKAVLPDVAKDNITVNVLLPGVIRTDRIVQTQTVRAEQAGRTLEEQLEILTATIPAGRLGESDEIAGMVAFLSSERASYVNGAVIQVDGGMIRSVV